MKSPFKFLDSYTKDDREIFFGREKEIEELYHRVFESKIMLVYGVSGTGKSSLIHCGLANKFSETDWLPIVIRRGGNMVESMAAVIKSSSITQKLDILTNPKDFKKGVRSLYLDYYKPVFFIFDQFEELFIFGDKEERRSFVQIVKSLNESEIQCRMIFVMREEYMAGVTEFEKYIPTFFSNRVRIEKMAHINALDAIKGPSKFANISLEEGFAEALLDMLSPENDDVELTYLQAFLDQIFRISQSDSEAPKNQKQLSFTLQQLKRVGNVSDLLGNFLDEQISLLSDPKTALAVLKSFVSIKGSKRQMSTEDVSEYAHTLGNPIEESALQVMIQSFISHRILRDKDQNGRYEVRHDALASKIYEKITLVEKELLEIRQFIENAYNNFQKRKVFLSASDLSYIAPYEDKMYLSGPLNKFIDQSKHETSIVKRRRRNVTLATIILLLVIFSGFTIWALNEKQKADEAGKRQLESIFKLNDSFQKIIKNQDQRKSEIYLAFESAYTQNPSRVREYWDKANIIRSTSKELVDFIYQLEFQIFSKEEKINIDSLAIIKLSAIKNQSNTNTPNIILFDTVNDNKQSNVSHLKQKIQHYKKTLYSQVDEKDWDKINFSLETDNLVLNQKGDSITWEDANFKGTSLAGAITNLNNLITEIKYIEIDAVNFIFSLITYGSFAFNVISPVVMTNNSYLLYGQNYEAQVRLSAYNSKQNMEAYIYKGKDFLAESDIQRSSGMIPYFSKNGVINFSLPADNIGINKYAGFISVRKPDGGFENYHFADQFIVAQPTILISPTGGNILYRGVENIIDVSVPGFAADKIRYKVSNGTLTRNKKGQFVFRAEQGDQTTFTVTVDINKTSISFPPLIFKIVDTPDPVVSIGNSRGGKITIKDIINSKGLSASLDNFHLDVKYSINGFTVLIINSSGIYEEKSSGFTFSEKQKILFSKLRTGDYLFVKDISALGTDGKIRNLNGLIFIIADN